MIYSDDFLNDIRARVTLESVLGKKLRLIRRGREFLALCPFHHEKTPSFTLVEEKGFYHCFGCGAHGDVFRFLMETDGLSFREAVERLAAEAGLPLPKLSLGDVKKDQEQERLYKILGLAASWFQARLYSEQGKDALVYIKNRGLKEKTIKEFSLGYAPNNRHALKEFLASNGLYENESVKAGLLIFQEDQGTTYDRFRNRLMFPIADSRGRVIAFGGRALDDQPAKYMNSPETPLFIKGRQLYNLTNALKSAREKKEIIVVEGYMDTIALAEAGIENVVAPLGTALTEEQLQILWKVSNEPVLCFDGDRAGQGAALRAVDRALPNLQPGLSLRFIWLPAKDDPDTIIRREGTEVFRKLIEVSMPLSELLWNRLIASWPTETPEQRAGLEKKVFDTLSLIKHEAVRRQYRIEYEIKLRDLFYKKRAKSENRHKAGLLKLSLKNDLRLSKSNNLIKTSLGRAEGEAPDAKFIEELILYTVLNHPQLASKHFEEFSRFAPLNPEINRMQKIILAMIDKGKDLDTAVLKESLLAQGLGDVYLRLMSSSALGNIRFASSNISFEVAEKWWLKTLERLSQFSALRNQWEVLAKDFNEAPDPAKWEKLKVIKSEINRNELNDDFLRDYDLDSAEKGLI